MDIVNLSHNDDLSAMAQKSNMNFRQLAFTMDQYIRKQGRLGSEETSQAINAAVDTLINVTIPNEVSGQIAALDIPSQVSSEVASQIGTDYTNVVSDFITADSDVVITGGMAHRWGRIAKISLTYRLANSYSVMSDGKLNNLDMGVLTSDWMTVGGLTNINLDSTYNIHGVIDNNGRVAFMSANSRGSTYVIDQNAVLYAGFIYILA